MHSLAAYLLGNFRSSFPRISTRSENCFGISSLLVLALAILPCAHAKLGLAAHRGSSLTHPENTLPAFSASKLSADFVEFDVRVGSDGEFYVIHDDQVDRTTNGSGFIANMSALELRQLDAGRKTGIKFAGTRIPTVDEALAEIQTDSAPMMEFKSGSVDQAVALLNRVPWPSDGVVTSFNREWLAELKLRRPDVRMGWLGSGTLTNQSVDRAVQSGIQLISWRHSDLDAATVNYLHARGLVVYAWTVNDPDRWDQLAKWGVDGIVTDAVELADAIGLFRGPPLEDTEVASIDEGIATPSQRQVVLDSGASAKMRKRVVWSREQDNLVVGRSGTFMVPAARSGTTASYRAEWTGKDGRVRTRIFRLMDSERDGELVNLSARVAIGVGERTPVVGWVTQGLQPARYLLRGVGPSLSAFGVNDPVPQPAVKLFSADGAESWLTTAVPSIPDDTMTAQVGAFPLLLNASDIAQVSLLSAGAHTVHLTSRDGLGGTGLLEVYRDVSAEIENSSRLLNLSFRGWVPPRGNLVAGFVVEGPGSQQLLIRGIGPGLRRYGLVDALADPWIRLVNAQQRVVAASDDWSNDDDSGLTQKAIAQTGSPDSMAYGGRDAALLLNLRPGAYTVILESVDPNESGVALLEIFHLESINPSKHESTP